jgi:phosphatidylglycerophosphate synthase
VRSPPVEGWILAAPELRPALADDVAGLPYALRLACDLAHAGCKRIHVIWPGGDPPALPFSSDPRLRGATLDVVAGPPVGDDADGILVVRADRISHRDMPKVVAQAWTQSDATVAKVAGDEHDAVVAAPRRLVRELRGTDLAPLLATADALAEPPFLAFTAAAPDREALRRAERELVWSLRKAADGLASKWINRHLSLRVTWLVKRTPIHPNHVTTFCFGLAVLGAVVLARGGWLAGVVGMLLVNLGSIIDGVDGELARLRYQFSRVGQWMDTLADDFGNVAYVTGLAINLDLAGVTWAMPLAIAALVCFALTQSTQYALITLVYKSGDLAAIPWAFQSHDFLSAKPKGLFEWMKATVPKTLKRDFALTMFVGLALIGRLDVILLIFSAGAISFFLVFAFQFARNLGSLKRPA